MDFKKTKKLISLVFNKIVGIAPFLMLGASAITGAMSSKGYYLKVFPYLPDTIGYSILTGMVMIKLYFRHPYCSPTKIAVASLITMNLISICFKDTAAYNPIYDAYICILCAFVIITLKFFR